MNIKRARELANFVKKTPIHPQWRIFRLENKAYRYITYSVISSGSKILDIGCGHRGIEKKLPNNCTYIGLDLLETATGWYGSKPDVFADAQQLPVMSGSVDYVLALEVLEHIKSPERVVQEAIRVLKSRGTLIISVPFTYPLHDEPYDFRRWTKHGLELLIQSNNELKISKIVEIGGSISAASTIFNLSLTELFIALINKNKLFWILSPILASAILISNVLSTIEGIIPRESTISPLGYLVIAKKL